MAQHRDLNTAAGAEGDRNERRARRALPIFVDAESLAEPAASAAAAASSETDADEPRTSGTSWDAGAWRERVRARARGFFGPRTQERMDEHEQVHRIDLGRAEDETEGKDPREQLLKLRSETRLAGEEFMASLRNSKILVPGFNDGDRPREFNLMHHVYMQAMMQSCMKPLARGVNTNSVIQAAGMMVAMRMLSPDFRQEMNKYLQPLKDKVQQRIDNKALGKVSSAGTVAAARRKAFGDVGNDALRDRLVGSQNPRDHLSKKWQKRYDDLQYRERGNRELFTPESAAMTEVALMENAFWKMREQDADVGQIDASYRALQKRLHEQMAEDGIERSDVVQRARTIIGERMEHEPELRTMFNGVAHGRIVKAQPHDERIAGTDHVRQVWSGELDDQLGHRLPDDGMLTLRRPMGCDAHQAQLAETMTSSMLGDYDAQGFADSVQGYLVGFAVHRKGMDPRGLPETLQDRLEQSETMLASLDIDGLPVEEQQRVYSNAYVDALEAVGAKHPDLDAKLRRSFGDDWQKTLQDAVDDPIAFYEANRDRPAQEPAAGPSASHPGPDYDAGEQERAESDDYQPA